MEEQVLALHPDPEKQGTHISKQEYDTHVPKNKPQRLRVRAAP